MKYFITSDVHGFFNELCTALNNAGFEKDNLEHTLIICGDLFDRGQQPRELYEFVKSLGDRFVYVRGNHEDLLFECADEIVNGLSVSDYHYSNGTVKTIADFCDLGQFDIMRPRRSDSLISDVYNKTKPLVQFINQNAVNYVQIGDDYICVHGWIPCIHDDPTIYYGKKSMRCDPDWNKVSDDVCEMTIYNAKWEEARWTNGMKAWKQGAVIPGKTIICGHWHCSWGWSHIRQKYKEFPDKNKKDWQKSFEPFVDDGIIALDACCAYSGKLNVVVLEYKNNF